MISYLEDLLPVAEPVPVLVTESDRRVVQGQVTSLDKQTERDWQNA